MIGICISCARQYEYDGRDVCMGCRKKWWSQRRNLKLSPVHLDDTDIAFIARDDSPEIVDENGDVTTCYQLAQRYRKELARRQQKDYRERR